MAISAEGALCRAGQTKFGPTKRIHFIRPRGGKPSVIRDGEVGPEIGGPECRRGLLGGIAVDFAGYQDSTRPPAAREGRITVKLCPLYACGNLCAERALSLFVEITSVHSSAFRGRADTEFGPDKDGVPWWHAHKGASAGRNGSLGQGVTRRGGRTTPCELRVQTHLSRLRPSVVPESVLSHGRTHPRKQQLCRASAVCGARVFGRQRECKRPPVQCRGESTQ